MTMNFCTAASKKEELTEQIKSREWNMECQKNKMYFLTVVSVLCLWKLGNIEQEPKNNERVGGQTRVETLVTQGSAWRPPQVRKWSGNV